MGGKGRPGLHNSMLQRRSGARGRGRPGGGKVHNVRTLLRSDRNIANDPDPCAFPGW